MPRRTRRLGAMLAAAAVQVALSSCGAPVPVDARGHGTFAQGIVGGSPAPDDSAVFLVLLTGDNGARASCSATLIAPHTLVTAAHCADPQVFGATSLDLEVTNAPALDPRQETIFHQVIETRMPATWNRLTLEDDLALLLLADAPAAEARAWNRASISELSGQSVRAVGYGTTGTEGTDGVRRSAELSFRLVTAKAYRLGDQTGAGVCYGDSGGPSFHTFEGGVERLVGVHSYTLTSACTDGADTRIDAHADFVNRWLQDHEPPGCGADGRCAAACTVPDPDCMPLGATCTFGEDCASGRCVTDAVHPGLFCSERCQADGDCPAQTACDLAMGACRAPTPGCGSAGQPACRPAAPVAIPLARAEGKVPPGCATLPLNGAALWLALAFFTLRVARGARGP